MENLTTFMNIRTDYGFKKLYGQPQNKHLLIRLLNAVFGDRITITDVVYHDKEVLPGAPDGKRIIYDIYCTSTVNDYMDFFHKRNSEFQDLMNEDKSESREHHFILEMQNEYEPPLEDRVLYYTSKPIADQGKAGWKYKLDPVVTILVTNFDFKHMSKKLKREIAMADTETNELFTDKMKIVVLSLKQIAGKRWSDCKTDLESILYLMSNMDKLEKDSEAYKASSYRDFFDASATDSFVAEEAVVYSQSLARLEAVEAGIRYAAQESYNDGMADGMVKGHAEGRAEGIAEGRAAGIAEGRAAGVYAEKVSNARNMLSYNIDIDTIKNVTGLSDEEISKLR